MAPSIDIDRVETDEAFKRLKNDWDRLFNSVPTASAFMSHEWLYAWWDHYGSGELYVLAARRSARLVGVLPLYKKERSAARLGNHLSLLGDHGVSSDFLDCLALENLANEVYEAFCGFLHLHAGNWDVLEFPNSDGDSRFVEYLLTSSALSSYPRHGSRTGLCPTLPLPTRWEDLNVQLSKKHRKNIRYYFNRLDGLGNVSLRRVEDPVELRSAFSDFLAMRTDRLDAKGIGTHSLTSEYRAFQWQVMESALSAGRLCLDFLEVDGQRVAFLYQFRHGTRVFAYHTGFPEEWQGHSVGRMVITMAIQRAISEGFSHFEFLRGDERYKYSWPVWDRELRNTVIYAKSAAALACRILDSSNRRLRNIGRRILRRNRVQRERVLPQDPE